MYRPKCCAQASPIARNSRSWGRSTTRPSRYAIWCAKRSPIRRIVGSRASGAGRTRSGSELERGIGALSCPVLDADLRRPRPDRGRNGQQVCYLFQRNRIAFPHPTACALSGRRARCDLEAQLAQREDIVPAIETWLTGSRPGTLINARKLAEAVSKSARLLLYAPDERVILQEWSSRLDSSVASRHRAKGRAGIPICRRKWKRCRRRSRCGNSARPRRSASGR